MVSSTFAGGLTIRSWANGHANGESWVEEVSHAISKASSGAQNVG
jgi:hypothetical protein